ncbi:precorrin-3B C(17)-methyltransferase [Methanomassiliicoccus luminyensis]|uniref:precorrin-3B C(17)-methyltransferase n=1 Tax=Methanomassiliicoccus luminyensis TaxID=1080712 RepID=UPI000475134D|nr:precorrin-3B C(17)-methyltransferase [Methanomassiliicoccus luminyensis]
MSPSPSQGKGKLYIVGTGPGRSDQMTMRARDAIASSTHVVGNQIYLDNVSDLLAGKEIFNSSMGREVQRAKKAVELAQDHMVSIVSGGDAGVYGMASIVLEIVEKSFPETAVEIVPGVTAASAAASLLGSPLSSDFMVISLSDLLTPWVEIERRLEAAFGVGVPVVLYNPKSLRRPDNLHTALSIAKKHLPGTTPIGVVKDAYRPDETVTVTKLEALAENDDFVDMHSTVVVGGLDSRIWAEGESVRGIITPRGYNRKYAY